MDILKLNNKLQVVKSADISELNFGDILNNDLFDLKLKISKALKHFNPSGTATFVNTQFKNKTRLTVLWVADEDNELRIIDDLHREFNFN